MPPRKGAVKIVNQSSMQIKSVTVLHKYSDVYKNQLNWNEVAPTQSTSEQYVDYNTGFLTTGLDWWLVTFTTDNAIYVSNPKNFRGIVDALEKSFDRIANVAAELSGPYKPAVLTSSVVAGLFINNESTAGFKEHMLTADDTAQTTEIIIKDNFVMKFHSKSGDSETVYTMAHAITPKNTAPAT